MAAMHRQLVISLEDLRYVSIECPNCNSVLTLDMQKESEHQKKHRLFVPGLCTVCQKGFDSAMPYVTQFRDIYLTLLPIASKITFRGSMEPTEISSDPV